MLPNKKIRLLFAAAGMLVTAVFFLLRHQQTKAGDALAGNVQAAVTGPINISGTNYYVVTSTDATEDTGNEVCAKVGRTCIGYTNFTTAVCEAVHPSASVQSGLGSGDKSGFYCDGAPQVGVCAGLTNTCAVCPACSVGVTCSDPIGGLYREMYVECSAPVAGGTITVTSNVDTNARDTVISFREALMLSNGTLAVGTLDATEQTFVSGSVGAGLADTINFNIGTASKIITVTTSLPLPSITDGDTIINGYTQTGASVNTNATGAANMTLVVELNGSNTGTGSLITFASSNNTVKGLLIRNARSAGITNSGTANFNKVQGNIIGLNLADSAAAANVGGGIVCSSATNWTIGTDGDGSNDNAERNVISGNTTSGISLSNCDSMVIAGNIIGLNKGGTVDRGNSTRGIQVSSGSDSNRIGTNGDGVSDSTERNVISGNSSVQIYVNASDSNTIAGNFIGPNVNGNSISGITSTGSGIRMESGADNNIIGTNGSNDVNNANERNIISGNTEHGVAIDVSAPTGNVIAGNYIGLDVGGTLDLGNTTYGIATGGGALNTRIGTNGDGIADADEGNVISGNNSTGIQLATASNNSVIAGNKIGTNAAGTAAVANTSDGIVLVTNISGTRIGTNGDGVSDTLERNIISGNPSTGILLQSNADTNTIAGNYIGLNAAGTAAIPNGNGVVLTTNTDNNIIGTNGDGVGDASEGNVISGNTSRGVMLLVTSTGNTVAGNVIGLNAAGNADLGNGLSGVFIENTSNNIIGTDGDGVSDTLERNVISGNDGGVDAHPGLYIVTGSTGNIVAGNYIGLDVTGTLDIGNSQDGILIDASSSNIVGINGDGSPGESNERNIISGNNRLGILLYNADSTTVAGNYIGTNAAGTSAVGNSQSGIELQNGADTVIIGTDGDGVSDALEGNVISGNGLQGIGLYNSNSAVIAGNIIGLNAAGTAAVANGDNGVVIGAETAPANIASNNRVGTNGDGVSDALERNVISGNNVSGVGVEIHDWEGTAPSTGNVVAGNYLGTDITGLLPIHNFWGGVEIYSFVQGTIVGFDGTGDPAVERNVISGNGTGAVYTGHWESAFFQNSVFASNYIGVGADGATAVANGQRLLPGNGVGVWISDDSAGNLIGGDTLAEGNIISQNIDEGILILAGDAYVNTIQNEISRNSIFDNGGRAIDLSVDQANYISDGVTLNDTDDTDAGNIPNLGMNYPVITNVTANGVNITVDGTLDTSSATTATIEVYLTNGFVHSSNHGDMHTFLGTATPSNNDPGNWTLTVANAELNPRISATATDAAGNTSEVSCTWPPVLPETIDDLSGYAGNNKVTLSWSIDSDCAFITDYVVQYDDGGGYVTFSDGVTATTGAVVTGLSNGTAYNFRVAGVGPAGTGAYSNVVNLTPIGIPDPIDDLSATAHDTQIVLTWTAPGGSPATDYVVQYGATSGFPGNATTFAEGTGTMLTAIVTGLVNGTSYSFRVYATNGVGSSPASNVITSTPAVIGSNSAPTTPTNLFVDETNAQAGANNPTGITSGTPVFSAICNDPNAGDILNKYRIQVDNNSDFSSVVWDSGAAGTSMTNCAQGSRSVDIAYGGSALVLDGTTYYWRIKFWDDDNAEGAFSETTATNSFTLVDANFAPTAPTVLYAANANAQTGSANPVGLTNTTPVFSAVCNDPDAGDILNKFRVQVDNNSDFSSVIWDSGAAGTAMLDCAEGDRSQNITFGGTPLALDGATYYWRIKFWDDENTEGVFSEDPVSTNTFTMMSSASSSVQRIQAIQQQNQQQFEAEQGQEEEPELPPEPAFLAIPAIGPVTVLGPTSVRYEWSYTGSGQNGFRIRKEGSALAVEVANPTAVAGTEEGLPHNTVITGRRVSAYNSVTESQPSGLYPDVVTEMPLVTPRLISRSGDRIQVAIHEPLNNIAAALSGVVFELLPGSAAAGTELAASRWVQATEYEFTGTVPAASYMLRVRARNQIGVETPWSHSLEIPAGEVLPKLPKLALDLHFVPNDGQSVSQPLNPNSLIRGEIRVSNVGEARANNVFLTLPLPTYIVYVPGTLSSDGARQTDSADGDFGQVGNGMISSIWPSLDFGFGHTIRFEIGFDTQRLVKDFSGTQELSVDAVRETLAQALASANPQILMQAQATHSDAEESAFSNQVQLSPDTTSFQPVEPEPTPEPEQPVQPEEPVQPVPTPEQTEIIEQILQEEFPQPGQPAVEQPIPQGPTQTDFSGGSFTMTTSGGGESLSISGYAKTNDDQIEFTGTASSPFTVITLIFNDAVTAIVVSDANGNWQTFVSASQLGIQEGQEQRVRIEAVAAKGDLRSERVQIADVVVSRGKSGDIAADFETRVGDQTLVTSVQRAAEQAIETIQENEPAIRTTLAVSAPVVVASSVPLWGYLPYAPTLLYHALTYLVGLLGRKKRSAARSYGVVYDSITKQPLALAIIRVYQLEPALNGAASVGAAAATSRKLVTTVVTDKLGRYDVLLQPGSYELDISKPLYLFPSQIVTTQTDGERRVYDGNAGLHVGKDALTIPDVPLDPINAKRQWQLAGGVKKIFLALQRVGDYLAVPVLMVGAAASALVVVAAPERPVNWAIAVVYAVLLALQLKLGRKLEKAWGVVYDIATNAVLPLVTVQLIEPSSSKIVASRLSDYQGRFAFLLEPGTYVIKAAKPGFQQVSEVVEAPQTDRQPLSGRVHIEQPDQRITGDIAMRQGSV